MMKWMPVEVAPNVVEDAIVDDVVRVQQISNLDSIGMIALVCLILWCLSYWFVDIVEK